MKSALQKKLLPLLLVLLCLFMLAGCHSAGKAEPQKTAPVTESESTPEPTEEPTPEPTPEPAPEPTPELTPEPTPELIPEIVVIPPRDPDSVAVDRYEENEKYAEYYSVTCGSNSNLGYAEYGVKNMRRQGYNPFLYTPLASIHSNCIMIGFFFTMEEAQAYAEELHAVHIDGVLCEQAYAVTIRVPNGVANVYQFRDWQ